MSETVKRYMATCDCMNEAGWGDYVRHEDYARLEQECERWKETAAGLDRQNDAIADEVAGAIKRAERLRGLLMEISKSEGRGVDWAQEIDAALSAKP